MRLLVFITQFYQLGGAERLGVELAEELNKRGIHADILSQYPPGLSGVAEATNELRNRKIPQVHFLNVQPHPAVCSMLPAILRLRRLIRQQEYDLVETSSVSTTALAAWATLGTGARHVAGLHAVFRADRENSLRHKLWRLSIRCNRRIRYYAISDYVAQAWLRYSGTPSVNTRTVYNAISDDCFTAASDRRGVRMELGIAEDSRIALYVGRLARFKGIDTLLDALGPVLGGYNMILLYVGPTDPNLYGESETIHQTLRRMQCHAEQNRWNKRIRFLEYRKDVPRLMASSDVLVHPTRREGFGLVLAEALAAGLPVVASNVGGIPEVLNGTDSMMVPPDDPEALRNAVLRTLSRSPHEASGAVARGRERAESFRTGRRVDLMVDMFREVLGSTAKRAGTKVN